MVNSMLVLRYVYRIPNHGEGNLTDAPEDVLYRPSQELPSIVVSDALVLRGTHLPLHISSSRKVYEKKVLDPERAEECDTWKYHTFYTVKHYTCPHVRDFLIIPPLGVALDEYKQVIISVNKF